MFQVCHVVSRIYIYIRILTCNKVRSVVYFTTLSVLDNAASTVVKSVNDGLGLGRQWFWPNWLAGKVGRSTTRRNTSLCAV